MKTIYNMSIEELLAGNGFQTLNIDNMETLTVSCPTVVVPACTDTTWTCSGTDGLEHSNCGNTRTTTPCTLGFQALQMIVGAIPEDLRYDVNNNGTVDSGDATLLMGGTPLRALHPANITATSFPTPTIPTGTYNTVNIDITWTNTGEQSGSFTPQVSIGGGAPISIGSSVSINAKDTYHINVTLTSVPSGSQSICPVPN
jgi:hypothetical protein